MLPDVGPDFINLNALARKVVHLLAHDPLATLADFDRKPHDRIAVCFGHPFR